MTARPTLSCILIFLDGEAFLDEAIASVVAQQDPSWELILVDDGSTDSSGRIAARWSATDPERIRCAAHPGRANLGMSASRNVGIELARGDLVGFVDCDDVWLPTMVGHVHRLAVAHPTADAVITRCWRWSSWDGSSRGQAGDRLMDLPAPFPLRTTVDAPALLPAIYRPDGSTFVPAMCAIAIRRDALLSVGGMESAFGGLYEDQVLYTKVAVGMRAVVDDRPLALYRQHPGSESARAAASGEWTAAPSAAYERFEAWQREHVVAQLGPDHPAVVALDEHGRARRPWTTRERSAGIRASVHRVMPDRLAWTLRRARDHARRAGTRRSDPDATSIVDVWSAQHLGALGAARRGRVRVVLDERGDGTTWSDDVARVAVPIADELVVGPLRDGDGDGDADIAAFDHVIVPFTVTTAAQAADLLGRVGAMVRVGGTVTALLAGPSLEPRAMAADEVRLIAEAALGEHDVVVETFGNATTAPLVRRGRPAAEVPGVLVDRHDPLVPVVLAISALPRRA